MLHNDIQKNMVDIYLKELAKEFNLKKNMRIS